MMFNKILIVVDKEVDIHNYRELLKIIFDRLDPNNSLMFSKGPLDVLDHSSSRFAFGSKLGIDVTMPFDEEIYLKTENLQEIYSFPESALKNIPEIENFYDLKENWGIPVCILSVKKDKQFRIEKLAYSIKENISFSYFKTIVIVDSGVDIKDLFTVVWLATGNLEPQRDISIINFKNNSSTILVDATIKTNANDNFKRDWPNVVVSSKDTINQIDQKWETLGLGDFISSPSLKYLPLVKNEGAIRK